MMIVKHMRGHSIAVPLGQVASARSIEGGWRVTDVRGEEHDIDDISWKIALETTPISMVSALPGTYVLEPVGEADRTFSIHRLTVVAWGVFADGATRPIIIDGTRTDADNWIVELPDGRVETTTGTQWPSADAWIAEENEGLAS